ncbi:MAG: MarR family transcriptional regulator [Bryobacteraceae bacterium]|jgi:DNA-binding MarR family transcriptional regulator
MKKEGNPRWTPQSAPTFWINHASRLIMRRFEERLRPHGFGMAYLPVVFALEESGPLLQKDLLRRVEIEQPTMTALLARMERDGIVRRTANSSDGRAQLISLTAKARSRLARVQAAMLGVVEEAMAGVSPGARAALMDALRSVVENLSQPPRPARSSLRHLR